MNDNQVDNRNSPSYLSHYGMHRAPFMTNLEEDMYYPEPTRTQRLDILLHLAQYGNELLLVTGPEGSGKTTMLTQFLKKAGSDWKICQINAHNMLNIEQLLSRISRGFNFPEEKVKIEAALSNLKRRLEAMLATHQTVLIIVDNAQQLTSEVLNVLLEFSNIRNISKGISLRVLLFSEPQIKIQLASPELQSKQTLPIRKIDLPAFDEQQTGKLIRHRVTTSGLASKSVFNDAIISKIYKYSEGWPGAITEIAHQVLFESTPVKRRDSSKPGTTSKPANHTIPVIITVIVIFALAALIFYQDQINALFNQPVKTKATTQDASGIKQEVKTLAIPAQSAETHSQAETTTATIAKQSPAPANTEMEFPVIDTLKPADSQSESTAGAGDTVTDTVSKPARQDEPQVNITEVTPSESSPTSPPVEGSVPSSAPSPSPAVKQSIHMDETSIPLARQDDWLLAQNPGYFSLQILAGYQASTINTFIGQNRLPQADLAYYFSLNRGKDWHSLVFGLYTSHSQAEGAARELAKQLPGVKPWIRSLKSIQEDIEYARSRRGQ